MKSPVLVGVGVLAALFGVLFMFQGLGAVGGSSMTGSNFWAVVGPLIAVAGLVLAFRSARRKQPPASPD